MTRLLILLVVFLAWGTCHADMGQIHADAAMVGETSQKAIILHNGTEEILILGTDLQADRDTGIVRFIPFPSAPQFEIAPEGAFEQAALLLGKHNLRFLRVSKGGGTQAQPVQLLLQKKLGAHDMTLIKVNTPQELRAWVNDYFQRRGLPTRERYEEAEGIVADYVNRGISYFVLDYVELGVEPRFIEPIQYRFASRELYYPLKSTNTFGGRGSIDLLLFLPGSLCKPTLGAYDTCLGLPSFMQRVEVSTSAEVAIEDIAQFCSQAPEFFAGKSVFMQMVSYWGDYAFDDDVFADVDEAVPHAHGYAEERQGNPWLLPVEDTLRDLDKRVPDTKTDKGQ